MAKPATKTLRAGHRVFRDIEKLFRLIGLYKGRTESLERHVKFVDNVLRQAFAEESERQYIHFDILMNAVTMDGEVVYKSEQPETSLAYGLFCEGVKAIVLSREVQGKEVLKWCSLVRSFLYPHERRTEARTDDEDLASLFWKSPFPHIRAYLFSNLMDVSSPGADEVTGNVLGNLATDTSLGVGGTGAVGETSLTRSTQVQTGSFHTRDAEWDLPAGDLIFREMENVDDLPADVVKKLREELSDVAISDRARRIVRFRPEEVEFLQEEMGSYDRNHVEFNSLAHFFSFIPHLRENSESLKDCKEKMVQIFRSVVDRFHGGLMLYILQNLENLKRRQIQTAFVDKLSEELGQTLAKPQNQVSLISALGYTQRVQVAKQLMAYVPKEKWAELFDLIEARKDDKAFVEMMAIIRSQDPQFETLWLHWGEPRLIALLRMLHQTFVEGRSEIFARGLRHRSLAILQESLRSIGLLSVALEDARKIWSRMNDSMKRTWAESLLQNPVSKDWLPFVVQILKSNQWAEGSIETALSWVKVCFRYLGTESLRIFDPLVSSRKMFFWPQFPHEREAILLAALQTREPQLRAPLQDLLERERKVIFQNPKLKSRLAQGGR